MTDRSIFSDSELKQKTGLPGAKKIEAEREGEVATTIGLHSRLPSGIDEEGARASPRGASTECRSFLTVSFQHGRALFLVKLLSSIFGK